MSGAGRTEAMHALEDLGYYCIDNLPASLFGQLLTLNSLPGQPDAEPKIAVVCDARSRDFFTGFQEELKKLNEQNYNYRLLFLDADDTKLVARYKSSRRRHPLCEEGMTIGQGIKTERSLLSVLREEATDVIDTTDMLPQQLRSVMRSLFSLKTENDTLTVTVYSFGFKYGAATDPDIIMDVRFLPNPYYDAVLRPLTGLDKEVRDYVMYRSETEDFLKSWYSLLDCVMPGYVKEGKQQLTIAIGCTGGQHRSVALSEATGSYLKAKGYRVSIAHRDLHHATTYK
ncbi:MAG: RNase adapter RapZ [Eggerthellaceae bacterium]|nr:RNase adapter RapZ [Eggerthellaceae bacterium]